MTTFQRRLSGPAAVLVTALAVLPSGCNQTRILPGLPPGQRIDTFKQNSIAKVDVLWLIDNSGSMADKQDNLANNFPKFFNVINAASVDYHIGVITTDTVNDRGQLQGTPKVITTSTPDPVGAFVKNVHVGTMGNAQDLGLDAVRLFFQTPDPTFMRSDAYLFIIMVSDADDASLPGDSHFFYRLFSGLKGVGNERMVNVSAIVGDVPNGCFNPVGMWEAKPATRYTDVAQSMGGLVQSICSPSFADALNNLGLSVVGLQRAFPLTKTPQPTTLSVTVGYPCPPDNSLIGASCDAVQDECSSTPAVYNCKVKQADPTNTATDGWVYQSVPNTIFFQGKAVPPKGSTVQIQYTEQGAGNTR